MRNFSKRLRCFFGGLVVFHSGCPIFQFKGVDPAVETCHIINLSINTCIISQVNSFMRDPVSLRASS